tara:strand:+ start:352 stop:597 length:246 start_codon:yes stop_codon:yes gene_type:complete
MKTYYANGIANDVTYLATVTDFENGYCAEYITKSTTMGMVTLSEADFETKLLGDASKSGYSRSILASAIYKDAKTKDMRIF